MKALFIAFIFSFCTTMANEAVVVPADWSEATTYNTPPAWGPGGKDKPVVPEPELYGLFLVGASLSYFILRRPHK